MRIRKEIKIGVVSLLTILLFIWGLNYLKGTDFFTSQLTFYAVYDDVTGLIESNPVSISGVSVGQVRKISFLPDGSGRIVLENIISKDVPIPDNSTSILTGMSLTGTREIIIELGDSETYLQNGDTLQSREQKSITEEVSQLVVPIQQKAENLFGQIDSVMIIFQNIFNEENQDNITRSFESIQGTLYNLENTTVRLDNTLERETNRIENILTYTESITRNLQQNNELLNNIMQNFSSVSDSIAAANIKTTLDETQKSVTELNQILAKINSGEGSMGMLVNDEELYRNLSSSSEQLENLLQEIRKDPDNFFKITVFGR